MKYYTEVIDRSESYLIGRDRRNWQRRNRDRLPPPSKPQRASRKSSGPRAESDAHTDSRNHAVALAPL